MSDKMGKNQQEALHTRQIAILGRLQDGKAYALSDMQTLLPQKVSPATLRRDIVQLRNSGYLKQSGDRKTSRYTLTTFGMLHAPINVHEYCAMDVDNRYGNTKYNFSLFQKIQDDIFSKKDTKRMDEATRRFLQKSKNVSKTLKQKELERFVIELSWKSSKIEGNTYTLLDTERLVKEGIQAPGHSKDEATMIMNHKKSFQYIVENLQEFKNISARNIEDIHRMLVEGLKVSFGLRTRQVGVTGSCYVPLSIASQIKEALEDVCKAVRNVKSPYAKALVALVGISYIQPFEDGNKRTARLITNAILMAHGCAPLSYRNVDEVLYHESMLVFYEKNSLASIQEICMDQYIFSCDQYLKFSA